MITTVKVLVVLVVVEDVQEKAPTPQVIDNSSVKAVYSYEGGAAVLECSMTGTDEVDETGMEAVVSWIRLSDLAILTIGPLVVTRDRRVQLVSGSALALQQLRMGDAGLYACQVAADPPHRSRVRLAVSRAAARILPGRLQLLPGTRLNLTCSVAGQQRPAVWLHWHHGETLLNTAARGGVSIAAQQRQT